MNCERLRAPSKTRMKPECVAEIRHCMSILSTKNKRKHKACVPGMNKAIDVVQGYLIKHATDIDAMTDFRDAIKYQIMITIKDNPKSRLIPGMVEAKIAVRGLLENLIEVPK